MRILHFADLHIGIENYSRQATEADLAALPPFFAPGVERSTYLGTSTRLLDFLVSFDELVDFALHQRVDLVLFCGDAYKSRDPSQTHQREFARRIARLASHGVPVFLLAGNHDLPQSLARATALDIFPTLAVPNVYTADHLATYRVETPAGPLQVVALPWTRRGAMLARAENRALSHVELTQYVEEELTRRLAQEASRLDTSIPAVLAAHVMVAGATVGTEQTMVLGHDHVLQRSALALPQFDYVALGHVHKHQALGTNPPAVYSGSLQRVDFSEEQDTKGFCLVELDPSLPQGRRVQWELVPVKARPFVTVDVEVSPSEEPTAKVLERIARTYVAGAVVRVRVRLPEHLAATLDDKAVRESLAGASYVLPIRREVTERQRPTRLPLGKEPTPYEALSLYLAGRKDVDDPAKRRALEAGQELLRRELAQQEQAQ